MKFDPKDPISSYLYSPSSTLGTPRPEPQTDWQGVCRLMAKDLGEYFSLSIDEVIEKYVNEYKENQW